jgi:tetratricopeptide (TPR) repeat protein
LYHQGRYSESLGYYELAVHFGSSEPAAWNNLGNNYLKLNDLANAFACFQRVIALDKNDFECLVNIGNCYITWNQPDFAIEYYLRAAIVNMKSITPFRSLAKIYQQKKHFGSALIFLNHC